MPRIFCIGRNYLDHIRELNNQESDTPVIFMKPLTALVPVGNVIPYPNHGKELHQETELVLKIGKAGYVKDKCSARSFISHITLGLDLTLRDLQTTLKNKGLPWECAKAFDGSAPIGEFIHLTKGIDLKNLAFTCHVNGQLRQEGNTAHMIFPVDDILVAISKIWSFEIGDLIYTGTPAGVGPINRGDCISITSEATREFSWIVA